MTEPATLIEQVARTHRVGIDQMRTRVHVTPNYNPDSPVMRAKREACYRLRQCGLSWEDVGDMMHCSDRSAQMRAAEWRP